MKGRNALLAALALLVLAMAGCSGRQPDQQQAETTRPATSEVQAPATTSSGTAYRVVTDQSQVSYAVGETFLGRDLNVTAVGTTSAIEGEIILKDGVIQPATVRVDVSTLKSDESRRDNQVRRALDTANHRYATYEITGAEGNPVLKEGEEVPLKLQGKMTIKGTTKPLVFDARAKLSGDTLTLVAESTFPMTMFGVNPPNIANFVAVKDEVRLTVHFVGKR